MFTTPRIFKKWYSNWITASKSSHSPPPKLATMPATYIPHTIYSPNAIVHLEYDPENIAPVPSTSNNGEGSSWSRFVCISDTHTRTFPVPPGDVLLHCGDLTNHGTVEEFTKTMEWLYSMPHRVKIVIAGNHDLTLHDDWYEHNYHRWHSKKQPLAPIKELLTGPRATSAGIVYLQDEGYEFQVRDGGKIWSVYGSPWSPEFFNWGFNYKRGEEAAQHVSKFPRTDILLTHGPVAGIFDRTKGGVLAGCDDLRARILELRPRLHLAGHIHEARGGYIHSWRSTGTEDELPAVQTDDVIPGATGDNTMESVEEPVSSIAAGNIKGETTVFVNAANWPSGPNARRPKDGGPRVPFGGPGFQPVVVDLKE